MSQLMLIAIDLVAIGVLTFGLYFPRHRRGGPGGAGGGGHRGVGAG